MWVIVRFEILHCIFQLALSVDWKHCVQDDVLGELISNEIAFQTTWVALYFSTILMPETGIPQQEKLPRAFDS